MSLKVGMTKSEIEREIAGAGTFVQIDHLTRFLKEPLTMEMKKFVYQKLADIYEKTNMFKESGKMYSNMADLSITFVEKIKHHMKSVETYVKGGDVVEAENAMKKAMAEGNSVQREDVYQQTLKIYKNQAELFETNNKRANALQIYEKLSEMRIGETERTRVREKLKVLYEQLGKRKELQEMTRKPITSSRPDQNDFHQRQKPAHKPGTIEYDDDLGIHRF